MRRPSDCRSLFKSLARIGLIALVLTTLAACGPQRKSVFPPTVTIQRMRVEANGTWQLTLRIQNNSYGGMHFTALDGTLAMTGSVPLRLHHDFALDIPAFAGDVLPLDVLPTPQMSAALAAIARQGSAGQLGYRIDGSVTAQPEQENAPRPFPMHGEGWLSPVPGIPDTYR